MNLAVFDVDGTLIETADADTNAFVAVVQAELGIAAVDSNWDSYPHVTSEGILDEIVRRAHRRPVTRAESASVQRRLVAKLKSMAIRAVPGAAALLRRLTGGGWAVALASGDWELSARHKLAAAEVPADGLPAAFCDDSIVRVEVLRCALDRARRHYRNAGFDGIVYVGDGAWDVRAARELGWGFVGIGSGAAAARLRALGAELVFPDYRDPAAVERAVGNAAHGIVAPLRPLFSTHEFSDARLTHVPIPHSVQPRPPAGPECQPPGR